MNEEKLWDLILNEIDLNKYVSAICPTCGHTMRCHVQVDIIDGKETMCAAQLPKDGTIFLCGTCMFFSVFDGGLQKLRRPTFEEKETIKAVDPDLYQKAKIIRIKQNN